MTYCVHLVEDDEDDYLLIQAALDAFPKLFSLVWLQGFQEAVRHWQNDLPDICLIDYRLGLHNGFDLIKKAIGMGINVPLILMTGAPSFEKLDEKAMLLGADDYISKKEFRSSTLKRTLLFNIQRKQIENKYRAGETELRQMHEIATSTLHNMGNVLNNLGISLEHFRGLLAKSNLPRLTDTADILEQNEAVNSDEQISLMPEYLRSAEANLAKEKDAYLKLVNQCIDRLALAGDAIRVQQESARLKGHESIELTAIIQEALLLFRAKLIQEGIDCTIGMEPLHLNFSRSLLLHVIINLVKNAIEALQGMPVKKITFQSVQNDDVIRFSIIDTGRGIDAETLPKLFGHGVTTRQDGNGFGLHFCRQVLARQECVIHVTSDGPGQGAALHIDIPTTFMV